MKLADLYTAEAPYIASTVRPATWRAYTSAWRVRISPTLGDVEIGDIDGFAVEDAWARWSGAPSTKVDALALLSRLMHRAVRRGYIPANPVGDAELPRAVGRDPVSRALTDNQWSRLVSLVPAQVYRDPLVVLHGTGLRWSEMAGLNPADVDFSAGLIQVSRSLSPGHGGRRVAAPTKNRGFRTVPMTPEVEQALRRGIDRARLAGVPHLALAGPLGGVLDGKNVARATGLHVWRDTVKAFPPGEPPLRWHDLRHTAAVNFFRAGVPAPTVQRILGHSSLAITQIYARASDDAVINAGHRLTALGVA